MDFTALPNKLNVEYEKEQVRRTPKIGDTVFRKIRVALMEKRRLTSMYKERTLQALTGDVEMRYSNCYTNS